MKSWEDGIGADMRETLFSEEQIRAQGQGHGRGGRA